MIQGEGVGRGELLTSGVIREKRRERKNQGTKRRLDRLQGVTDGIIEQNGRTERIADVRYSGR